MGGLINKPRLNRPQHQFLIMPQKFRAFVGGFGAGKTWIGSTAMIQRFYKRPRQTQGYFAPTYPHIRDIFFPTIDEVAHGLQMKADIREANKEVHFYSGGRFRGTTICRSMDKPGNIIGFKIAHAMIDELDVLPPDKAKLAWRKILARLRWENSTGAINGADVTTTPEGFRETYRLFVEEPIQKPKLLETYGLIQASTRENEKFLPDGYIESLIDTYPSELIDAYVDARFCNLTSGTVYYGFNRVTCFSGEKIEENEPLHIGMDFNVMNMAATIYVRRGRQMDVWHGVGELVKVFDTPAMINLIKSKYPGHNITIYPDASGASRKSVDASKSDIALLREAGFHVKVNPTNPAVKDRILAVNKRLQDGKLFFTDACRVTMKNLEQQSYDDNGEPDKKSGFDHQNDATGYPIAHEYPILRPMHKMLIGGH
jgi:hypothetical protein